MALSEYNKLRDISKSPEPEGGGKKSAGNIFVVHELIKTKFRGKESWLFFKRK